VNKKIILALAIPLVIIVLATVVRFSSSDKEEVNVQDIKKEEPVLDTVKVYFPNSKLDPEVTCQKVFSVERRFIAVSKDPSKQFYYEAAVTELLNGPNDADISAGYETAINKDVGINKIEFADGTVRVDFNKQMEFEMGGSCRVGLIRLQIEETLKQFPEIKHVLICVDGRTEDILQP